MDSPDDGRYFLMGVPSGYDDETLRKTVGDQSWHPDEVYGVHWCKPAENENVGGTVRLNISSEAAKQLKDQGEKLFVGKKRVTLVDKYDLPLWATSTIDDDVVELVKHLLASDGVTTLAELVGDLKMTKFQHKDGYDCWRVEGSFAELKQFELKIRDLLFEGVNTTKESGERGKKRKIPRRRPTRDDPDDVDRAIGSGESEDGSLATPFDGPVGRPLLTTTPSMAKVVLVPSEDTPFRFEFCIGNLADEKGIGAIVNPTDFRLDPDATELSKMIKAAMGNQPYQTLRLEALEVIGGSILETSAVVTPAGNIKSNAVIHVALPIKWPEDTTACLTKLSHCYESVLASLKTNKLISVSIPPLGREKGLMPSLAAGGAVAAFMGTDGGSGGHAWNLASFVNLVRFVFTDPIDLQQFVDIFSSYLDPIKAAVTRNDPGAGASTSAGAGAGAGAPVTDDAKPVAFPAGFGEKCKICLDTLNGMETSQMSKCQHNFHTRCIKEWLHVKPNCPNCLADAAFHNAVMIRKASNSVVKLKKGRSSGR